MLKTILIFCFLFVTFIASAQEKIDINTATIEELQIITGIGPVYAQRIIDNRPFSSIDDLININGIGEKTLQKIKDQGLAYLPEDTSEPETSTTTPSNETNEISTPSTSPNNQPSNQAPIAKAGPDITALTNQEIFFDGTASSDPENDSLTYFWNFGDGATDNQATTTHIYQYPGEYLVVLEVDDGKLTNTDFVKISIYSDNLIISEFIPNPEGKDAENEWIEIYNQGEQTADLSNWQLDDMPDGSKPFTLPQNTLIFPKEFVVFQRLITKLALNNDEDQVRLIYPNGNIAAEISYLAEKKQGQAVAFDGQEYFWTTMPTPGTANIISSNKNESTQNYPKNNPKPQIQTSQEPAQTLAVQLNQTQNYQTNQPEPKQNYSKIDSKNKLVVQAANNTANKQTVSLNQSSPTSQNPKLILYLSILISSCLFISWLIILTRKKNTFNI